MMWRNEDGRKWLFNSAGGRWGRELQRHRPCRARPIVSRSSLLFLLLISADMCYDDVSNQETRDAPAAAAGRRGTDQPERGKWTFTTTINLRRWSRYRRKIRDLFVQMHKREWLPVYTSFHLFSVLVSAKAAHHLSCDTSFLRSAFRHDDRSLPRNQGCHVTYYTLLDRINKALLYNNNNPIRVLQYKSK